MITDLASLKQRFAAGDIPAPKDFVDLIDTLAAFRVSSLPAGSVGLSAFPKFTLQPDEYMQTDSLGNVILGGLNFNSVTGDGSLSGTYPNIEVAANGIKSSHIASQAVSLRHFNQTEGSPNGYVLTSTGSGFTWQPVSAGLSLTRVAASGAVRRYRSGNIALPSSPSAFTVAGVHSFNQSLTHGLGFAPDSFRVCLVCQTNSAGYTVGQEVPVNQFSSLNGKPIFYVDTTNTTVDVRVLFDQVGGGSDYTMQVYDGSTPGQVDTLSMVATDATAFSNWSLVVYADAFINGDGFGDVTGWTSTPAAITAVTATSTQNIANLQGVVPNSYLVTLRCVTTDGTFSVGDEVAIDDFTNSSFEPAFTVKVNTTNYVLTANIAAAAIVVGTSSGYAGITLANWNVVVRAMLAIGTAVSIQPTTALQLNGAAAAVAYNGTIFAAHASINTQRSAVVSWTSNHYGSLPAAVASWLSSINLQNGNVTPNVVSGAFPSADLAAGNGSYDTFGRAQMSMVRWPAAGKNALMWIRGNDTYLQETNPEIGYNVPYGADNISVIYPDAASPTYASLGAAPRGTANTSVSTPWTISTANPYPQHAAIIQVDDTGTYPAHPDLYVVCSQYHPVNVFPSRMANCYFGKYTYNGTNYTATFAAVGSGSGNNSAANVPAGAINWLNPGISGISARLSDIFSVNFSTMPLYICMVRYNPVKKLFYVIDSGTGMLHIYSLAVTLQNWLSSNLISGYLDHSQLTYQGSYILPATPSREPAVALDLGESGPNSGLGVPYLGCTMRDHWSVEFDLVSGQELSLVVTHGLRNEIERIPWTYPL